MSLTLTFGPDLTPDLDFDPRTYGAQLDLRNLGVATTTLGSPTFLSSSALNASNAAVGKLCMVRGGGTIVASRTDGAMTIGGSAANILTSAGAGFTNSLLGRRITITGVGVAGATLVAFVWGVISPTQLRLTENASTTATGCLYEISDDLYGTVLASSSTQVTLDTNAGTTGSALRAWVGTDDAAAVNACIVDAVLVAGAFNNGPTIRIPRSFAIGSTILVPGKLRLLGEGTSGFSALLSQGSTGIRALRPGLSSYIRAAQGGSGATGVAGCGMGNRGSITSGTAILTDPDQAWVAGDAGKRISVIGAGVQVGSQYSVTLDTTIVSVDSPTQVTLAANASTTVVEGYYSWLGSGVSGAFAWCDIERFHLQGSSGHKSGLHLIGTDVFNVRHVTASEFRSGCGYFADGAVGSPVTEGEFYRCQANNCRVGFKGGGVLTGTTIIDGNDNQIGRMPGPGTIAIDGGCTATDKVIIQAYETCVRSDGSATYRALRLECFQIGILLGGAGGASSTGNGNQIECTSWSTSGVAGSGGRGLVLQAGVQKTTFNPGFYFPTGIGMYNDCDATALLSCICHDPNIQGSQVLAYAATLAPDLALGKTITVTLTGNVTAISAPVRGTMGIVLRFVFLQDGTGARTVSGWDAIYKVLNWVPNTGAGKRNTIDFTWDGTNWVQSGATVQT